MPWWASGTLLDHLETIEIASDRDAAHRRFPVQWVIRPMSDEHHDYRGYAGQVAGGEWRAGDEVVVLPSGLRTRVAAVETSDGPLDVAVQGMSVVVRLEDDLDVPRGEMLADPTTSRSCARTLEATVCWMSERPVSDRRPARRQAHDTLGARRARRDRVASSTSRHSSRSRRTASAVERHRPRPAATVDPADRRPVHGQPHDRRLRPRRRGDERHRRGRHGRRRAALSA